MLRFSCHAALLAVVITLSAAADPQGSKQANAATKPGKPAGHNANAPKAGAAAAQAGTAAKAQAADEAGRSGLEVPVVLPEHPTDEHDAYLCTSVSLPDQPLKLVGIQPNSDQRVVHHMLLFGCKAPARKDPVWDCRMMSACGGGGGEAVLYGWGKNAPAMTVPEGAGFSVGPGTSIRSVVLQIHYLEGRPANDTSGLTLRLSPQQVPHSAGMVAFAASFSIPPRTEKKLVENACCYDGWEPLSGFASRVHTHALGREVYLDIHQPGAAKPRRVVSLDPQEPQGFYPIRPEATVLPGDKLAMACRFNSSGVDHAVHAGATHADEMCNLYLMLYSQLPVFSWCLDGREWVEVHGAGGLPEGSQLRPETMVWRPPEEVQLDVGKAQKAGGKGAVFKVGQVPGVASTGDGTLWAFNRGDRAWQQDGSVSGGKGKGGREEAESLVQGPAVLQLDQDSGEVLRSWGAGVFALPHMITLDWDGDVWVTDVELHQALKFSQDGKLLLELGTRRREGKGPTKLCKPTQVAVARDGSVFVSDGYCNSRVAEFTANGTWVRDFELPQRAERQMEVPHSVVVHECRRALLVADREGGRVHAFQLGTAKYQGYWDLQEQYGLPYALALGPYGSVLALTWQARGTPDAKTWVVMLGASPGAVSGQWEVPGVEVPHDLALAPAPLELTRAGERLLAIIVSETSERGSGNLHKFVLTPPDHAHLADSGAPGDAEATVQALPAYAAAHGGHSHANHGDNAAADSSKAVADKAADKPSGMQASHIGHVALKPVDGGSGNGQADAFESVAEEGMIPEEPADHAQHAGKPGSTDDADVSRIGHTMVKPVDGDGSAEGQTPATEGKSDAKRTGQASTEPKAVTPGVLGSEGDVQQQQKQRQGEAQEAAVEAAGQQRSPRQPADPGGGKPAEAGAEGRADGKGGQQKAETGKADVNLPWERVGVAEEGSSRVAEVAEFLEDDQGAKLDSTQQQQQQQPRKDASTAGLDSSTDAEVDGEAAAEAKGVTWHPKLDQQFLGRTLAQPWLLGLVFVVVALVSWNRLQHWRGRSGAGYQLPRHQHAV